MFPTPPYSLRTAVLGFVLFPLLLVIMLAGWSGLRSLESQVELRMQQDIELVARAIQLPLSDALTHDRRSRIQQALDSAFRIDQVYGAYVYDESGELIAASGPRSPSMERRRDARLATVTGTHGAYDDRGGDQVYSFFMPLTDAGGRINGLLQVTRHGSDFRDDLAQVRSRALLALGALSLLLLAVVFWGHQRAVGRHVDCLLAVMERVGQGDRLIRAQPAGPHELRLLTEAMNRMLEGIHRSGVELEIQRRRQANLEARLRQSEKLAAIGRLAAGVAHELGTPLGVINGQAQRALRHVPANGKSGKALINIRREVQRMDRIVRQLLDFGRCNPSRTRPEPVGRLVKAALFQVADEIQQAQVALTVLTQDDGPVLPMDRPRLEQALTNLLRNALHEGRRVQVSWDIVGDHLELRVDDDGPGIDPAHHRHLFEPFFTTKPVGSGTGLGLSVAHSAVTEHQGDIVVMDSPLGGARVVIRLPMGPPLDTSPDVQDGVARGESGQLPPTEVGGL
ncbi:His Kinase A (phospho-acceptor) domain-containing protein [Ectothiorhodospira magna]|uniref:histidine kinase n=1 Tax=Ectothiorhodospira magna TaxID=867345 RepID=A0A1H9EW42_9GAMM|nr:ATP-binding protein [Ectothiorhodospira magna]SEQ29986.1 His Kinase A (phospho-acceptor) domain-containing protein [Ectothiorhodospira magna]